MFFMKGFIITTLELKDKLILGRQLCRDLVTCPLSLKVIDKSQHSKVNFLTFARMSLDEKAYHNLQLLPVRYSVPLNFHVCYVFHERVYSNRFLSVIEGGMYPLQSQVLKSGAGMLGWAFSKSFKNFLRSFKGLSLHWIDNDTHIHIHTHTH